MRLITLFCLCLVMLTPALALSDYKYVRDIDTSQINEPVWLPLTTSILDNTESNGNDIRLIGNQELPYFIEYEQRQIALPITNVKASSIQDDFRGENYLPRNLFDGNTQTYYQNDFLVDPQQTTLDIDLLEEYRVESFTIQLNNNQNIVTTVWARTQLGWQEITSSSNTRIGLNSISTNKLSLVIQHQGSLQISEIDVFGFSEGRILFLPDSPETQLFYGKQNDATPSYDTSDLFTTTSTPTVYAGAQKQNPQYIWTPELQDDNCPNIANPDQKDSDNDGVGDACDVCVFIQDSNQADSDNDGVGDACDNCRLKANPDQLDRDLDRIGWVCDDNDGDGITNDVDNCLEGSNRNQQDVDRDGIGDVCEDDDADGVQNYLDLCPATADPTNLDNDNDGKGNVCDNCPSVSNRGQLDDDANGVGNLCEDEDQDQVVFANDNCPLIANQDQVDWDNDGLGDACDNCPEVQNRGQADIDRDGIGDACDQEESRLFENPYVVWTVMILGIVIILFVAFSLQKKK